MPAKTIHLNMPNSKDRAAYQKEWVGRTGYKNPPKKKKPAQINYYETPYRDEFGMISKKI